MEQSVYILKQMFTVPYSKAQVSIAVHQRVGQTLLLNLGPDDKRMTATIHGKLTVVSLSLLLYPSEVLMRHLSTLAISNLHAHAIFLKDMNKSVIDTVIRSPLICGKRWSAISLAGGNFVVRGSEKDQIPEIGLLSYFQGLYVPGLDNPALSSSSGAMAMFLCSRPPVFGLPPQCHRLFPFHLATVCP
ncbi:hypothetical protein DY000_02030323 [Brassica cretica]|uniref:Uncharacterized protein n=1 Tax=Brassica cretica TaxID=69181 RepID=A0ABQ7DIH8_BRACR|nr:hypothetical protein DY000_02030323 [Brassica cretica]